MEDGFKSSFLVRVFCKLCEVNIVGIVIFVRCMYVVREGQDVLLETGSCLVVVMIVVRPVVVFFVVVVVASVVVVVVVVERVQMANLDPF